MVPSDGASSTWALTDAQAVELGADCSTWVWSWWKDWNKPPGYEYGGIEVNSAVLRQNQYDPPRWRFRIGTSDDGGNKGNSNTACESLIAYVYKEGTSYPTSFATDLTLTRVEDGAVYPHNINLIDHVAYPHGTNCFMYFRHSFASDDYSDEAALEADFESFFYVGSHLTFAEAETPSTNLICDASLDRYTGFSNQDYASKPYAYCHAASAAIDIDPWLVLHSGWVGLVVDADMAGGNIIPFMGRIRNDVSENGTASSAAVAAALPPASLNCSLVVGGTSYHFTKSLSQATVAPVRHGHTVTHVLVTNLLWTPDNDDDGEAASTLNTANMDAPVWWVEVSVWAQSVTVQIGWQEKGVNDGCAVCDDGVVTLEMTVEGETHRRSKAFTAGTTAIDTVAFRFDVGPNTGDDISEELTAMAEAAYPVQVFSDYATPIYRNGTADVILEMPSSTPRCGYGTSCSYLPIIDVTLVNPTDNEAVLHLTLSRNFAGRHGEGVRSFILTFFEEPFRCAALPPFMV